MHSQPKGQVLKMRTTLQILQQNQKVYEDSIVLDLYTCERYNSSSCSGTYIYQLLKGMVHNAVVKGAWTYYIINEATPSGAVATDYFS